MVFLFAVPIDTPDDLQSYIEIAKPKAEVLNFKTIMFASRRLLTPCVRHWFIGFIAGSLGH